MEAQALPREFELRLLPLLFGKLESEQTRESFRQQTVNVLAQITTIRRRQMPQQVIRPGGHADCQQLQGYQQRRPTDRCL